MIDDRDSGQRVRDDHYLHWGAMILAAAYMWQVKGALMAIGLLVLLIIAITLSNLAILSRSASMKAIRWSRWGWVIAAFIVTAAIGTEVGNVG
jgi:hypothetical protein